MNKRSLIPGLQVQAPVVMNFSGVKMMKIWCSWELLGVFDFVAHFKMFICCYQTKSSKFFFFKKKHSEGIWTPIFWSKLLRSTTKPSRLPNSREDADFFLFPRTSFFPWKKHKGFLSPVCPSKLHRSTTRLSLKLLLLHYKSCPNHICQHTFFI